MQPANLVSQAQSRERETLLDRVRPRWRKMMRDLWADRARSVIVLLAMVIGVFGIGIVVDAYAILTREMQTNYLRTNPASAILYLDAPDPGLVDAVAGLPQVAAVEARGTVDARIQAAPGIWRTILLFVVDDYNNLRVDTFTSQAGQYPPRSGEVALERAALPLSKKQVGDSAIIQVPGRPAQTLALTGSIHAPGLPPAWMEGFAYGYVTPQTMEQLGGPAALDALHVVFRDTNNDETRIRAEADRLAEWLAVRGQKVSRIQVPRPGKHPHADQMASLLFLLEAFGLLALLLSGVLVATMISALLSQQIRQIGVMKAIGGRRRQVAGMYLGAVTLLGLLSLVIGMPMALAGGRGYAAIASQMLNFNLYDTSVPLWAYALQAAVGIFVPLLAAAYPVLRGSRITVRQALSDYGIAAETAAPGAVTRLSSRLVDRAAGMARPTLLSIRNTFRRRGRLVFTLLALALGGAMFVVALNVSASMDHTVAKEFETQRFDLLVNFDRPYPLEQVNAALQTVPGVASSEDRSGARANRILPDGTLSLRQFSLVALSVGSSQFSPILLQGRWLQPGDTNAVVINHKMLNDSPDLKVGDVLRLKVGSLETEWRVVGVIREAVSDSTVFVPLETFTRLTGQAGSVRSVTLLLGEHDEAAQNAAAGRLEAALPQAGIAVSELWRMVDLRQRVADHLQLIAFFLGLMSVLVVIVGGLGLTSTMSINVLERRRELGILRAIGAPRRAVLRIILSEGVLIGLLSWALACLLAWPLSVLVGIVFGNIFFQVPLYFAYSPAAPLIWLALSLILSILASSYPARGATRLPVREVLAYE